MTYLICYKALTVLNNKKVTHSNVLMTNEMHNSYNQFLFRNFFLSVLHVSKEASRSSSGARHNVLCSTVYYAVLLMMND